MFILRARGWITALMFGALAASGAVAQTSNSREETVTLQRRLADAGCYRGPIDGAAGASVDAALKQCPDMKLYLRVETGMHTATMNPSSVDAACSLAATSSDDKTVRIWSLPDGLPQRILRLPIGDANEGKVYSAMLSPDGKWVAAGGYDAAWPKTGTHALYLIELATSQVRRFDGLQEVIVAIAFNADASRVAVGLGAGKGVRIFDVASGRQTMSDPAYGADIYGLAFAPDGALIATSLDGSIRRYGRDGRQEAKRGNLAGKWPFHISVSPDGSRLAVGFYDSPRASILDIKSLRTLAEADTTDLKSGNLQSISWSADGRQILAAGTIDALVNNEWRFTGRRFTSDGARVGGDVAISKSGIMDLHACGDGYAYAAADPAFGIIDRSGNKADILHEGVGADMRDKTGSAFAVSSDGSAVRFGAGDREQRPILFDLARATLSDSPSLPAGFDIPRVTGLPVSDWLNGVTPKFRDTKLVIENFETVRSLAIRPDNSGFALGADFKLRAYDSAGKELWKRPGPGAAWGVVYSRDEGVLVSAYDDGTIRWLRPSDGAELLALFVEPQTKKWVAWTPSGYYMASTGAEDLIGWHLNRGWGQLADFFPASRFSDRFNRPDIVKLVLKTRDEAAAIRQANETARRTQDTAPLAAALPPVVRIVSPVDGATTDSDTIQVQVDVRSPSGLTVDRVDAMVDGRPVEARGFEPAGEGSTRTLTVPVPSHDFELAVVARSGSAVSEAVKVRLRHVGAAPAKDQFKPKLYLVAIGVSDYIDPSLRLGYAANDAVDFAAAMHKQEGGMYSKVEVRVLADREATRAAVLDALDWLDQQVTSRDVGMLMIAGHGLTDDRGRYWFLPADASVKRLGATAVSQDDLRRNMSAVSGKAIVFLDTCHANAQVTARGGGGQAEVDMASLVNDLSKTENGLVTFAASQGSEVSRESSAWGHGAFSAALIEGLGEGKADLMHKGEITVSGLDVYVAERVKTLTEGHQHPVMSRPSTVPDFAFATPR